MDNNNDNSTHDWDFMSNETFAKLGKSTLVYIREETASNGEKIFTTHGADGVALAQSTSHDDAFRSALDDEFIPLTLH